MTTPYEIAARLMGVVKEVPGDRHDPYILHAHRLCSMRAESDEVPWCSAFVNAICFELGLPRTDSAAARSWLHVGSDVWIEQASKGFDVVVLERGAGGHVGFYDSHDAERVWILGGNQGNAVNVMGFPRKRVLGIRRLAEQ